MKGKVVIVSSIICFALIFGAFSTLKADTLLFPVIAVNPSNVTTLISVYNLASGVTHLKYTYRYKESLTGSNNNVTGGCTNASFVRNTKEGDLVSFDVSGTFNSGNALFSDTDSYGGSFNLAGSGLRRAYLLITHSDSSGNRVDSGDNTTLMGEAVVMDISTGAAWGYKAINDDSAEDYTFVNYNDGGGVYTSLSNTLLLAAFRSFTFFPPSFWTTKFFITPIGGDMLSDRTATAQIIDEVIDRLGTEWAWTTSVQKEVKCTAALNVKDFIDSTVLSSIENTGGWSFLGVVSGDAIIYKLEYALSDSSYGGTINNGYLLSTYEFP